MQAFGEDQWAGPGIELRTKWIIAPERGITEFVWERSVNGGDWEVLAVAESRRVPTRGEDADIEEAVREQVRQPVEPGAGVP